MYIIDDRYECVFTIKISKPLETHEQIVGNQWEILSMVYPIFYVVIVVMSGDVLNPIILITLMIFVKV